MTDYEKITNFFDEMGISYSSSKCSPDFPETEEITLDIDTTLIVFDTDGNIDSTE